MIARSLYGILLRMFARARASVLWIALILTPLIALFPGESRACLWDRDTLAQERGRFPELNELLAGLFNRHSPAFYAWRAKEREAQIAASPTNLAALDDLGVAYDKLGRHEEAIATGNKALALDPRRYETLANLGTFYVHAGRFALGLPLLEKAVEVNPAAHFGREKIQVALVKYVAKASEKGPLKLPVTTNDGAERGFAVFYARLLRPTDDSGSLTSAERDEAITGLAGMMRFGTHQHPILAEALGDVLSFPQVGSQEQQLAARAYLKSALAVNDPAARAAYEKKAEEILHSQEGAKLADLQKAFADELAQGEAWAAQIAADEAKWIAEGVDAEASYEKKYADSPVLQKTLASRLPSSASPIFRLLAPMGVLLILLALLVVRARRRKLRMQ